MTDSGTFPDLQPEGGAGSMYASSGADAEATFARRGLYLHGEQHFAYHRQVSVGDVLEGRMRTSQPIAVEARRGPMEVTYFQTRWTDLDGEPGRRRAHRLAVLSRRLSARHRPRPRGSRGRGEAVRPGERLEPEALRESAQPCRPSCRRHHDVEAVHALAGRVAGLLVARPQVQRACR